MATRTRNDILCAFVQSCSLLTFGIEEISVDSGPVVPALLLVPRDALVSGAGDHLHVLRQVAHSAHRLDAQDAFALVVGDVQLSVQRAHRHEILVRNLGHAARETYEWSECKLRAFKEHRN